MKTLQERERTFIIDKPFNQYQAKVRATVIETLIEGTVDLKKLLISSAVHMMDSYHMRQGLSYFEIEDAYLTARVSLAIVKNDQD